MGVGIRVRVGIRVARHKQLSGCGLTCMAMHRVRVRRRVTGRVRNKVGFRVMAYLHGHA